MIKRTYLVVLENNGNYVDDMLAPIYVTDHTISHPDQLTADDLQALNSLIQNQVEAQQDMSQLTGCDWTHVQIYEFQTHKLSDTTGIYAQLTILDDQNYCKCAYILDKLDFEKRLNESKEKPAQQYQAFRLKWTKSHAERLAGAAITSSSVLLGASCYLVYAAATIGSAGFEVGAALACTALVACAIWAICAVKQTSIKHQMYSRFHWSEISSRTNDESAEKGASLEAHNA